MNRPASLRRLASRGLRLWLVALTLGLTFGPFQAARAADGAQAFVEPTPWSAWWWPATRTTSALFAGGGALDKYDQYVAAATGTDPGTRAWEREHMSFAGPAWAGHCNGAAAAALLEPEPLEDVTALGVTFSVADLKALLVDYHFGDAADWSFGDDDELSPADFHRMLLNWVQGRHKGFALTFDLGQGEVWSYAVYQFESEWVPDAAEENLWHVTTTVWMADTNVAPSFTGTRAYPSPRGKTFTYDLRGDPQQPGDGEWTGQTRANGLGHPSRIWYPSAMLRNTERELVSPGLDRKTIGGILAGGDDHELALPMPRAQ